MFSALSKLPPVNMYAFAGLLIAIAYIAFTAGRTAYRNTPRNVVLRCVRWAACALLTTALVAGLAVGRWVPASYVGVGTQRVYLPGWHVYPGEQFVTLPRAGMFNIPYPDDCRFLEVSYLITDSERLTRFSEEIATFRSPVAEGVVLFGASKRDAWKFSGDPFAAWLCWKTSKYLPTSELAHGDLDVYLATLASYGISTDCRLLVQQWRSRK